MYSDGLVSLQIKRTQSQMGNTRSAVASNIRVLLCKTQSIRVRRVSGAYEIGLAVIGRVRSQGISCFESQQCTIDQKIFITFSCSMVLLFVVGSDVGASVGVGTGWGVGD